jgi:hypothetical protein
MAIAPTLQKYLDQNVTYDARRAFVGATLIDAEDFKPIPNADFTMSGILNGVTGQVFAESDMHARTHRWFDHAGASLLHAIGATLPISLPSHS